jgi:hypothetical protein
VDVTKVFGTLEALRRVFLTLAMKGMSDMPDNASALSTRRSEWKAGCVPAPSAAVPGILNCTVRSLRLSIPHTVSDFSDSNQRL